MPHFICSKSVTYVTGKHPLLEMVGPPEFLAADLVMLSPIGCLSIAASSERKI